MKKYRVGNIDCAVCAAKFENSIRNLPGVDAAFFNYATSTLHLKTDREKTVIEDIVGIEPGVELVPIRPGKKELENEDGNDLIPRREMIFLGSASILFVLILVFEERFHASNLLLVEYAIVLAAYFMAGWNVIRKAFQTIRRKDYFDENVLMVIATVGAMMVHAVGEAVGVMLFFKIGELFQDMAVARSRRSIRSVLAARPDVAHVKRLDGLETVEPEAVNVGDVIRVKPGEKIPLDGVVLSGRSQADTSALTGESIPVEVSSGSEVMAGQINLTEAIEIRVTRRFQESSISRVLDLVENAVARKSKTEHFMTTFARYYTPAVVFVALCIAIMPPLIMESASFKTWLYRALVLLVISCPCALVVSIPLGYFGGIGRASRSGILLKGSQYIDALAAVKTVVFDKTGTLTRGVFEVKDIFPSNGYSPDQLLEYAATAEQYSNHPIARSIVAEFEKRGRKAGVRDVDRHTDLPGNGIRVEVDETCILVGNDRLMHKENIDHGQCMVNDTVLHVAVDGMYAGFITIGDSIHEDSGKAIAQLRQNGVDNIIMLSGDHRRSVRSVSENLNLDACYPELLPEDKVAMFETISAESRGGKIAFVGDGINDAPVLARSDVGIAMGAMGSDAAVETADVVLMDDSPLKLSEAIKISRATRKIVVQNIVFVLLVKAMFVILGAMGIATMWEAVFADVGTALLAVVNSTRLLKMSV